MGNGIEGLSLMMRGLVREEALEVIERRFFVLCYVRGG